MMSSVVRRFENTSDKTLMVQHVDGIVSLVPPGGVLQNIRIENLKEMRGQASITMDLGEIQERGHANGRTQLRD